MSPVQGICNGGGDRVGWGTMDKLAKNLGAYVEDNVQQIGRLVGKIPGSAYVGRYIAKSHQNDPYRTLFELILFIFALRYFLASKQSYSKRDYLQLTEKEMDELCSEWQPAPLVAPLNSEQQLRLTEIAELKHVESPYAVDANDTKFINLMSTDVFGHATREDVKLCACDTMRNYGVGSCGPAGFYGNEDVHIHCEESLARFLGTDSAILYSQGVSTAPSVIPCFAKRGDVLVVDDAVSMAIQRGLQLSRAKLLFYAHNDLADLKVQLGKARALHRGKKIPRRFIVTEGLFENTGNSPDLKTIVALKHEFKFRIILDESWSLGMLGKSGRGVCEEQGVDRSKDIDVTIGSLAAGMGTYGGFCAGSATIIEHQRIVSLAYTFSATEPPYLAAATTLIADQLDRGEHDARIQSLREKTVKFTSALAKCPEIDLISRDDSPMVIFRLNGSADDDDDAAVSLQLHNFVMAAREQGVLVSRLAQVGEWESFGPVNAIKVFVPEQIKPADFKRATDVLTKCAKQRTK